MRKTRPNKTTLEYKVGRGRPPVETRWKPGQSGNPKGRPRGVKNLATIFHEALNQKLEIQDNGGTRMITAREGIVRRLINQALKGDIKATSFVLAKEPEIEKKNKPAEKIASNMSAAEVMKIYLRTVRGDDE